MSLIIINPDSCKSCGSCAQVCPTSVLIQEEKKTVPVVLYPERCISCGHCVAICRGDALTHKFLGPESIKPIDYNLMPSFDQITQLLKARRSVRVFRDKLIDKAVIEQVIDGSRYAGSAENAQTTRYLVIQDKYVLKKISESASQSLLKWAIELHASQKINNDKFVSGEIMKWQNVVRAVQNGMDPILRNAPVLILFYALKGLWTLNINANLALCHASLVCTGLGLGSFYAGFIVSACEIDDNIHQQISIPYTHRIYGALAIGYPKFKFNHWIERKAVQITWI